MTRIDGSSPTAPTPGSDSGSTESTDAAAPKRSFDEVMGKKQGDHDGKGSDDGKKDDAKSGSAKHAEHAKKEDAARPRTVAEWRAMKAEEKSRAGESASAEELARQNPALARPMDVRQPAAGLEGAKRVDALIPKQKMDQIVDQCRIGVNRAGATEMQFDLKSDVLGGLTLKVSTVDGRVYATFLADQPGVKDLVDMNAAQLEKALRDKGLGIGQIKTEMRHGLLPEDQQRQQQQQQQQQHQERGFRGGAPGSAGGSGGPDAPARRPPKGPGSSTDYVA